MLLACARGAVAQCGTQSCTPTSCSALVFFVAAGARGDGTNCRGDGEACVCVCVGGGGQGGLACSNSPRAGHRPARWSCSAAAMTPCPAHRPAGPWRCWEGPSPRGTAPGTPHSCSQRRAAAGAAAGGKRGRRAGARHAAAWRGIIQVAWQRRCRPRTRACDGGTSSSSDCSSGAVPGRESDAKSPPNCHHHHHHPQQQEPQQWQPRHPQPTHLFQCAAAGLGWQAGLRFQTSGHFLNLHMAHGWHQSGLRQWLQGTVAADTTPQACAGSMHGPAALFRALQPHARHAQRHPPPLNRLLCAIAGREASVGWSPADLGAVGQCGGGQWVGLRDIRLAGIIRQSLVDSTAAEWQARRLTSSPPHAMIIGPTRGWQVSREGSCAATATSKGKQKGAATDKGQTRQRQVGGGAPLRAAAAAAHGDLAPNSSVHSAAQVPARPQVMFPCIGHAS